MTDNIPTPLSREEAKTLYARKFSMWLAVGALSMMFAGFTSAYIVKKADTELWNQFEIPSAFLYSTICIVLSSATLLYGTRMIKSQNNTKAYYFALIATLVLGSIFCYLQYIGWTELMQSGVFLRDDISGAFFYVITGSHFLHVIGGIVVLAISIFRLYRKRKTGIFDLVLIVDPVVKNRVDLVGIYWHFVDVLWLYLYFFLVFNHQ